MRSAGCVVAFGLVAGCTAHEKIASKVDPKYGVSASPRVVEDGQPVPRGGGTYRIGAPYTIGGRTYVPKEDPSGHREEGIASWYGRNFHGRRTANGEIYDMHALSAAHPTLPIPSYARVTNLANRKSIVVRVNDRGPFHDNRAIDLSVRTAQLLGFHGNGIARVRVEYVGRASLDGSDDARLMATLRENGEPAPAPSSVMVASNTFVPRGAEPALRLPRSGGVPVPPDRPFEFGPPENPLRSASLRNDGRRAALDGEGAAYDPPPARSGAVFVGEGAGIGPAAASGRGLY